MKQGKFAQMKKTFGQSIFWLALLALAALFACACSGDDKQAGGATEETQIAIEDKTVAGVSEKGPFTVGSAVHIYELEFETLGHTGRSIPGKIASDRGDFRFTHLNLECQFAFMEVSGYYRNENTGKQSTAPITLNALVDLSDKETANINLLTHLAFERTLFLVNEGKPVKDAKQQAEQEILKAFHIENELIGDFEGLSIFKKGEGNAALLAISSLMQADLAEGDFSERLANFAYDIEKDGVWNDSVTATAVADWASAVSLSTYYSAIRSNIKGWKISDIIPDFEKSMDKFWWENYGLGDCDKEREGVVKANTNALSKLNGVHFICKDKLWRLASDIEKDTATWGVGEFDGEIRPGQVNKGMRYIYEDAKKVWREASEIEVETYQKDCLKDGKLFKGNENKSAMYVCDGEKFRIASDMEILGELGCTSYNRDSYHILTQVSYPHIDSIGYGDMTYRSDKISKNYSYYKCTENGWALTIEKLNYGTLVDARDGHEYKTIGIGSQMWMAENLNYGDEEKYPSMKEQNWCQNDARYLDTSCAAYGRYYTWCATIDCEYWARQGQKCGYGEQPCELPKTVQGICPEGWHVPNGEEWETLYSFVNNDYRAMQKKGYDMWQGATDEYGFSAIPAGIEGNNYFGFGGYAFFWSSSVQGINEARNWYLQPDAATLGSDKKHYGFSVRCIKDEE